MMLQSLDKPLRLAFVLGAICELEASEAAQIAGISEVAFRKRLSRARATLDKFMASNCGVANAQNRCRCVYQVNRNVERGILDPKQLRFAAPTARTNLDALRAYGDINKVRHSLELYRAQPELRAPDDLATQMRQVIASAQSLFP
jgi:hypothetical protein